MNRYTASKSTSFIFLVPIMTLFLSWLLLGEFPALLSLVGGGLALGGVYFYQKVG
jgi:drug/metabolite transporter (DMT)-like permease